MPYKITIVEVTEETYLRKEWVVVSETGGVKAYDYTPGLEQTREVEKELYRQNVDTLDLQAVIKAANGIKRKRNPAKKDRP